MKPIKIFNQIIPLSTFISFCFLVGVLVFSISNLVWGAKFKEPTQNPPLGDFFTPLNEGSDAQTKIGDLKIKGNLEANKLCFGSQCLTSWPTSVSSQWVTSGSDISYTTGKVGIGTDDPKAKLDVKGSGRFIVGDRSVTIATEDAGINLGGISTQGDSGGWAFGYHAKGSAGTDKGGFGFYGGADSLNYYYIGNSYLSPSMVINSAGNVGIGTNPETKLDVAGGIRSLVASNEGASLTLRNPNKIANGLARDWVIYNMTGSYGNSLQFWNYDTLGCVSGGMCNSRLTITDTGNVGIGTIKPATTLDVAGTGDIRLSGLTHWGLETSESPAFQIIDRTNNVRRGVFDTSGNVYLGGGINNVGGGESTLAILTSGNVGIGTTTPFSALEIGGGQNIHLSTKDSPNPSDPGDLVFLKGTTATDKGTEIARIYADPSGNPKLTFSTGTDTDVNMVLDGDNLSVNGKIFSGGVELKTSTIDSGWIKNGSIINLSNNSDNVGIGTTEPGSLLAVSRNITGTSPDKDTPMSYGQMFIKSPTSITTSGTNYILSLINDQITQTLPAGVIDSGYRLAFRNDSYVADNNFAGTLATQIGVESRTGIHYSASTGRINNSYAGLFQVFGGDGPGDTGTIDNAYGVYIAGAENTKVTNRYALYTDEGAGKSYFGGNVGIGTNPETKLDVAGGIRSLVASNEGASLTLRNPNKIANGLARDWVIYNMTGSYGNSLQFWNYDTLGCVSGGMCNSRLTITDTGNVGIGTTEPGARLHLANSASGVDFLVENSAEWGAKNAAGVSETWMWPRWSDNVMYTNFGSAGWNIRNKDSANVMFMTNTGNVGIGTTGPVNALLHLGGPSANGGLRLDGVSGGTGPVDWRMRVSGPSSEFDSLFFETEGTTGAESFAPKMTIRPSGNVGIGTTEPESPLHVRFNDGQTTNKSNGITIENTGSSSKYSLGVSGTNTIPAGSFFLRNKNTNNNLLVVTGNGDVDVKGKLTVNGQPMYAFGGMFVQNFENNGQCVFGNPFVSSTCACPTGFTAQQISYWWWAESNVDTYYCYKL